jgi:hypothetical protein
LSTSPTIPIEASLNKVFEILTKINYGIIILSGFIVWLIMSLLFHLTALMFNGYASFGQIAYGTSYLYIIPSIMILIGIFLLDNIQISNTEDAMNVLLNSSSFKLTMNLINYSMVPYYLTVGFFIRHIYGIKYVYAFLSVIIPIVAIWLISELFKFI